MDALDQQLIAKLRHNARASIADLAAQLTVSRGTVTNRIGKLEREGVIGGYTVKLRPDAAPDEIRAWTSIAVEGNQQSVIRALLGEPGIAALHDTNGRWDLLADLRVGNLQELAAALERFRSVKGISATETSIHLINDTSKTKDATLKFFTKALETRSLLIIPIRLRDKVLGLLGLHDTHGLRVWLDEEVAFLESIAQQLAIGYQYTSLYVTQEQETRRTNALLEIANTLNSSSNFKEVSADVLERAIGLVGADYGALGVLDQTGKRISLASFKSAEGIKLGKVLKMIEQHNKSLDIDSFSALGELLHDGKTLRLVDSQLPFAIRLFFNTQLGGKAALVTPVHVAGKAFGLLGFVWSKVGTFADHDIA